MPTKRKGQLWMNYVRIGYFSNLENQSWTPYYHFDEEHVYPLPRHVGPLVFTMSSFSSLAARKMLIDACMATPAQKTSIVVKIMDTTATFFAYVAGVSPQRVELRPIGPVTMHVNSVK